ncbi:MAG: hypothetical protein RLZZ77_268 [Bacteroidota bacterium]
MNQIKDILLQGDPISLKEMDKVALMNRTDTKFVLAEKTLIEVLEQVIPYYSVLEINGARMNRYETLYYDTPDFKFYLRHQNGKKNRLKIRKRSYVDSHLTFLEVKFKSNKDRTIKDRTKLQELLMPLDQAHLDFIETETGFHDELEPKLMNSFSRITLVGKVHNERITIDTQLQFNFDGREALLPGVIIVEAKQEKANRHSYFIQELKRRVVRPESISKYCIGAALLYPELKQNNFKEKLIKLRKIAYAIPA